MNCGYYSRGATFKGVAYNQVNMIGTYVVQQKEGNIRTYVNYNLTNVYLQYLWLPKQKNRGQLIYVYHIFYYTEFNLLEMKM